MSERANVEILGVIIGTFEDWDFVEDGVSIFFDFQHKHEGSLFSVLDNCEIQVDLNKGTIHILKNGECHLVFDSINFLRALRLEILCAFPDEGEPKVG